MCPIDLFDTLEFRENRTGQLEFECRRAFGAGGPASRGFDDVPAAATILSCVRSSWCGVARAFERGAKLRLIKRIPAAAGLAADRATPPRRWLPRTKAGARPFPR